LTLGQSLDTLSGGELQRVKLATELDRAGNTYILDEPTTGLHMADIEQLLHIFNVLVDKGNTLIIIEHNLDVIANADWIIDIGPGAGQYGGEVVFAGRPNQILTAQGSLTGKYLNQYIRR
jgi:excinuclease UvrABC ATPase subunit